MPKQPWQIATDLAVTIAVLCTIVTTSILLCTSFSKSLTRWESDKGRVPAWALQDIAESSYSFGNLTDSGLAPGKGSQLVRANCTNCHSAKLITQNRMTRDGWRQTIIWMQQTQGLWDLGANQGAILDYLSEHYAPESVGRRAQLEIPEGYWYDLSLD